MKWLNYRNLRLLLVFISQDLRGRYVGSALGIFWNIINPLIILALYTFIFQYILNLKYGDHVFAAPFIFCGLLPWMAISESLNRGTVSIIENSNLVQKVVFPKEILILYVVASSFFHELMGMTILIIYLCIFGTPPGTVALLIIFIFILQLIFSAGLGFFFSTLNVFIRDTTPLLGAFMTMWFFLTPIVYDATRIPGKYQPFFKVNPLYYLVNMYRAVLLENKLPNLFDIAAFSGFALLIFVVGLSYFQKNKRIFADYI